MESLRSLPTTDAVAALVRDEYRLEVTGCELVRSFVNDVYRITTPGGDYALKLYRAGRWGVEEVAWEQELLVHCRAAGLAGSEAAPLADGRLAGTAQAPEGPRPFTLCTWVEGDKPKRPSADLYRRFGAELARFHQVTDGFVSARPRRSFDLGADLDAPLRAVLPSLDAADAPGVAELAAAARTELAGHDGDWGACHGDVSLDNVHLRDDELVLHDFDLARPGWRARDLTGVASTSQWEAFQQGYTAQRALDPADLRAVPWLRVVDLIGNLCFHLVDKPTLRGSESRAEGWADRELRSLRELRRQLLQPPAPVVIAAYTGRDEPDVRDALGRLHDTVVALDPIRRLRHQPGYVGHEFEELVRTVETQRGCLLVARVDGAFVGVAAGFVTQQSAQNLLSVVPTTLGVISDVFVAEAWRGRGVGERLLRAVETHLEGEGCDSLWVDIVAFNEGAHRFYSRLGYVDREIGLLKTPHRLRVEQPR